jgi:hypothetical protein
MNTFSKIAALLTLGVVMTMPQPVALDLPGAIVQSQEPALSYRIGVVTNIVESNNITVAISGSSVLVTASYLFPQYQPMLGDRVYVVKQDSQWFILGAMSGQVNSELNNPSFEEGTIGAVPSSWAFTNSSILAGTPTFQKQTSTDPLSGSHVGRIVLNPIANNVSSSLVASALIPARPGQIWSGGAYLRWVELTGPNEVQVGTQVNFYNNALVSIGTALLLVVRSFTSTTDWVLLKPDAAFPSAIAPAGTAWVSLEIGFIFNVANFNFSYFGELDYAILRHSG